MSKKKAYVRLTQKGKIIPGSMIVSNSDGVPKNGNYKEIITNLCCGDVPFAVTSRKQKAWVCYDGDGEIIPGSLVVGPTYPQDRKNWREILYINSESIRISDLTITSNGNFSSYGGGNANYVGQSFTLLKNCSLQNIIVRINRNANPSLNMQLVIYKIVDGTPTDIIMGTSNKISINTIPTSSTSTTKFTFSNVYLPAGQYLFISKYTDVVTHNNSNNIIFRLRNPGGYTGGSVGFTSTADSGATWDPSSTLTYDFISKVNYLV
jgi:hypothetical protein